MVERQLPKLHTRVRFPSPAPSSALDADNAKVNCPPLPIAPDKTSTRSMLRDEVQLRRQDGMRCARPVEGGPPLPLRTFAANRSGPRGFEPDTNPTFAGDREDGRRGRCRPFGCRDRLTGRDRARAGPSLRPWLPQPARLTTRRPAGGAVLKIVRLPRCSWDMITPLILEKLPSNTPLRCISIDWKFLRAQVSRVYIFITIIDQAQSWIVKGPDRPRHSFRQGGTSSGRAACLIDGSR